MKKLCICIPTYNRSSCIEHILKTSMEWTKELDFDFYISDSSTDGKTKAVIEKYKSFYGNRLIYELDTDYPDKTSDLKVMTSFMAIQDKYEYIHLSGDGLVVDIPNYMKLIEEPIQEGFDIIHFNYWLENDKAIYSNGHDFAKENGWYATYYGATVLSSSLIRKANYQMIAKEYRNTGFMYWYGMLNSVACENLKIVAYKQFPLINNPFKPTNSSYQPGRFVKFWIIGWDSVNDSLPAYYDDIKAKMKKDIGIYLKLYSFRNLMVLRESGNLDRKVLLSNRHRIKQVTDVPFIRFLFMSIVPIRAIKIAKKIKNGIKKSK